MFGAVYKKAYAKDSNHDAIADALKQKGCSVVSLAEVGHGVPDLLVGFNGQTFLLEVKVKSKDVRIRPSQERFYANWKGGVGAIVHSVEEAWVVISQTIPVPFIPIEQELLRATYAA